MGKVKIITALFDIGRESHGDGRSMEQYLGWFEETLKLNSDFIIYTEEKFSKFIELRRDRKNTEIRIQKIEEIPAYCYKERISNILKNPDYLSKIKDPSRIECNLDLYNIIQYSKFGWIEEEILKSGEEDFYFWMDAGCSRFFYGFDLDKKWPNPNFQFSEDFIIQGNINTGKFYPSLDIESYKWENNCILVGTLFGGRGRILRKIYREVIHILEKEMLELDMVNNEQIALGILYKLKPDLFEVYINLHGGHLPLFRHLGD